MNTKTFIVRVLALIALFSSGLVPMANAQGSSAHFDRELGQYLSTADSASLSVTGDITVAAWIKLDSSGEDGVDSPIVAKQERNLGNVSYKFVVQNLYLNEHPTLQRQIQFYLSETGDGQNVVYATSEFSPETDGLPLNEWIYVAATWQAGSGNIPRLYVNGVEAPIGDSAGSISSIHDGDAATTVGSEDTEAPSGSFFDGNIADVRIWNSVRTQKELEKDMKNNSASNPALMAFWRLNGDLTDATNNNPLSNPTNVTFTNDRP